jgi:hypothetical protein
MNTKLIRALAFAALGLAATIGTASADPNVDFGFSISGGGFSIDVDSDLYGDGSVCFYKNSWFGGSQKCYDAGEARSHLNNSWNDRISSFEVFGGAVVTVCTGANYSGTCQTYDHDRHSLPNSLDNRISSFEVY